MTRNGVLQKLAVGVILMLAGLAIPWYFVTPMFSRDSFHYFPATAWVLLGFFLILVALVLLCGAFGDWRTRRAFERTFKVELPSWKRDFASIQDLKRKSAQHSVAKVLRWAKNDFQSWADEEDLARRQKAPADQLRTTAETVQERKAFFFYRRNLAKYCGIAIPQELQSLKPTDQFKAAVR